ncbi:MAG: prephenate dehydrogenase, partial [Microbacteriaceae bacterium]
MVDTRLEGPVRIVGAGLLGASIGLGLRARGVDVILVDSSATHLRLAIDYGAGRAASEQDEPKLIVVAVPPEQVAEVVARELKAFPNALVTDVASVKLEPLEQLRAMGADVSRYIGTHPMAGRERGGPASARADLFLARPWVIAGHDEISYRDAGPVEDLILDLGATPIELDVKRHDESVALVSHVPQLVSSLMAARLAGAEDSAVALAGGGLRDVTRIAASNPELWLQILQANTEPVLEVLREFSADLARVIEALSDLDQRGARSAIVE